MRKEIFSYIKFFGVYFLIISFGWYSFLYQIEKADVSSSVNCFIDFWRYPFYDILQLITFIPIILLLVYFLKKVKSKGKRILLISSFIPFMVLILTLFFPDWGFSLFLKILFITFFGFLGTLIASKKDISLKKEFLITELLMFLLSILFIVFLVFFNFSPNSLLK